MRTCFILLAFVSLLCSCKRAQQSNNADILVTVKDRTLNRADIISQIPRGIPSADSLLIAEDLVKKWVKNALIYDVAVRNLGMESQDIDKLVEEYRYSLYRYRYQERLIKERVSANIRDADKLKYYEENQDKFKLDKALIRGLFLKIPADAPALSDLKSWYRSSNEESLEKIEKYSVQNATIYDYFYDRWVDFDDVIDNIPIRVSNANTFLSANKNIEVSDSTYCYLLNISEFLPSGSIAPYEYAEPQIVEMLINQRKMEFLKDFENELYNDAIKNGTVKFAKEP